MDILTFVLVSIGIILLPGPSVLVIVSTSLCEGKTRGLQTVAGTSLAMIIQLMVAALGTSWLVHSLAEGFFWLKWIGVAYLVYLGIQHFLNMRTTTQNTVSAIGTFQRGFWVSLTNPKTILFFSAFLPQFADASGSYAVQIAILSFLFWGLALMIDSTYVILANKLSPLLKRKGVSAYQNGISGTLYLGAGAALAATKNS